VKPFCDRLLVGRSVIASTHELSPGTVKLFST